MVEIHSHYYKPIAKFFGTPHLGIYYGVELELDVVGHFDDDDGVTTEAAEAAVDILGDFCYIKHDGSIAGIEIVTHPASLQVHRLRWRKFFNAIPEGFTVSQLDGLHHHFSRKGLTKHQIWLIHQFVNSQAKPGSGPATRGCTGDGAPWLVKLAGRDFNKNCRRVIKPEMNIDDCTANGKYESVNCKPEATVEVRLYAATLDYTQFMLRLEFTAAMVQAVQQGVDPLTVQSLLSFLRSHPKRFPVLVPWMIKEAGL